MAGHSCTRSGVYDTMLAVRRTRPVLLLLLAAGLAVAASPSGTRLLRQPDISEEGLVFVYAGELWSASRTGESPRRLTTTAEAESYPKISPDGKWIAFTRNGDVYVIPSSGGEERRLTWHPSSDRAAGWTPDSGKILIMSGRFQGTHTQSPHLFLLPYQGGWAEPLPVPRAPRLLIIFDREGYSPDWFKELWDKRMAALIYRKYAEEDWPSARRR